MLQAPLSVLTNRYSPRAPHLRPDIEVLTDLKLKPRLNFPMTAAGAPSEVPPSVDPLEPFAGAMDIVLTEVTGPPIMYGRRGRRPSVSAHNSPTRRAAMMHELECISPAPVRRISPPAKGRMRRGKSVEFRSVSASLSGTNGSTGSCSVASFVSAAPFSASTTSPSAPCESPPALDMSDEESTAEIGSIAEDEDSELEQVAARMVSPTDGLPDLTSPGSIHRVASVNSDAGDALVRLRITSSGSSTPHRVRNGSFSSVGSDSSSASACTRQNRKRRASRLHATLTPKVVPQFGQEIKEVQPDFPHPQHQLLTLEQIQQQLALSQQQSSHPYSHHSTLQRPAALVLSATPTQPNKRPHTAPSFPPEADVGTQLELLAQQIRTTEAQLQHALDVKQQTAHQLAHCQQQELQLQPAPRSPTPVAEEKTRAAEPAATPQPTAPQFPPAASNPPAAFIIATEHVAQPQPQPKQSPRIRSQRAHAHSRSHLPVSSTRAPLISVLSCVLSQLFSNPNDTLPSDPALISMFHTERIPSISIGHYLDRIAYYSECSEEALVMAFIHISRIYHSNTSGVAIVGQAPGAVKPFQLNTLSIHRLLLVAIMCSAKWYDDAYYNNAFFGKIGGVSTRELNALEVEFLALIAFELYIPAKIYRRFYKELVNAALHPTCQCAYAQLPPLNFDEALPASPAHDCDLHELMCGTTQTEEEAKLFSFPTHSHSVSASSINTSAFNDETKCT